MSAVPNKTISCNTVHEQSSYTLPLPFSVFLSSRAGGGGGGGGCGGGGGGCGVGGGGGVGGIVVVVVHFYRTQGRSTKLPASHLDAAGSQHSLDRQIQ